MLAKLIFCILLAAQPLRQLSLFQKTLTQFRKYFSIDYFSPKLTDVTDDDKTFKTGMWKAAFYRGEWKSDSPQQFGYISKTSGPLMIHFDADYEEKNTLEFYFEIYENEYVEDKFIFSDNELIITSQDQTSLVGKKQESVYKIDRVFSLMGEQKCTTEMTVNLADKNGKPVDITTDDLGNIVISGSVVSQECGISFTFKAEPKFIDLLKIVVFTILAIGFVMYGMNPLYRALRENNINQLMYISDEAFLFNIMTDVVVLVVNMSIATRILIEYFEFLTLFTMFLIISILFKMRFMHAILEIRLAEQALNEQEMGKKKFIFYIKFVLSFIILGTGACFSIYYYHLYYLLFLYPLFQIWHNFFNVLRRNCFFWKLHFQMIVPQMFYPIALRTMPGNMFHLHTDYSFVLVLLTIVLLQMGIMFGQKYFGPSFFLPNALKPNYFNYFKKLKDLPQAETVNCPICFIALNEQPDQTQNMQSQLTMKKYMETPCKHMFHEHCLQKWMNQKMICPCCRTAIPPY